MTTIAIGIQKGGSGKSATTHALAEALAGLGKRVLMVDCDPQSTLTGSCGVNPSKSLADVIGGAKPGRAAVATVIVKLSDNLSLIPSNIDLATSELGLISRMGREAVLSKALAPLTAVYDYILLDCPPSLSLLTVNALTAADRVLIPIRPSTVDLHGLRLFLDSIAEVQENLNNNLSLWGVLPTFFDGRVNHHKQAIEAMQADGLPLLPVRIAQSVRVSEAAAAGQSIVTYAPGHKITAAYNELAEAMING